MVLVAFPSPWCHFSANSRVCEIQQVMTVARNIYLHYLTRYLSFEVWIWTGDESAVVSKSLFQCEIVCVFPYEELVQILIYLVYLVV